MTLANFLFVCNEQCIDVDVYSDFSDELEICYCGDEEFGLTEEGRKEFSEILNLEVGWNEGERYATVLINDRDDVEKMNDKLCLFFAACAGYVSDSLYRKWFSFDN